jgi:small subunit ribosomal protein S1
LGIKQLRPDPWETVPQKYKVGQVVNGTITSLTDFGAFVELEEELEGLIHISELGTGEQKIGHPSDAVKAEDKVTVIILNVDPRERKIGLSIKALLRKKEREEIKQYVGGEEEVTSNLGEMIQDEMQKNRTEDKPEGENEGA